MARASGIWTNTDAAHWEPADLVRTDYILTEILQNEEFIAQFHDHTGPPAGAGTITAGAITTATITASGNSLTIPNHTVAAGSNRLLVVHIVTRSELGLTSYASTVTYGGTGLTLAVRERYVTGGPSAEIWYLVAPAVGTADVVITLTGNEDAIIGAAQNFTGVNQSTPVGTGATHNNAGEDTPSITVTSAAGELVIDTLGTYDLTPVAATTPGAGQTQDSNLTETGGTGQVRLSSSHEAGTASVAMSWSTTGVPVVALAGIPLKPATASGGGGPLVLNEPEEMLFRLGAA